MKSVSGLLERLGVGNRFFDTALDLVNLRHTARKEPTSAKRFLFLQYDTALGSVLNATPVYESLRRAIPDAYIAVVASGFSYAVLKSNPYVDKVYETPSLAREPGKVFLYVLRHMRSWREEFDCVVTDSFNNHTKLTALQIASGVPLRVGYANRQAWVHYPLAMSDDHNVRVLTSVIENNLRILELLGHPTPASEPSMFIDKADLLAGDDLLRQEKIPEGGPLIAFAVQGSGAQPVNWFDERFVELGNRLFDRYGARLAFFGTSRDGAGIEKIRLQMRAPSFNFAGKTAIPTLAAIFCRMDLMISVATGLMHLGRAIQLPLVLLASAYQTSKEWLPAGIENCLVLRHGEVPCALCWKPSCATRECMQAISVEDVMQAVEIQFQKFPPTAAQREQRTARAVAQTRSQALSAGQAVPVR